MKAAFFNDGKLKCSKELSPKELKINSMPNVVEIVMWQMDKALKHLCEQITVKVEDLSIRSDALDMYRASSKMVAKMFEVLGIVSFYEQLPSSVEVGKAQRSIRL